MNRTKQLGEEKVLKLLVTFSIPAIVGMVVNALYNVVDRIYIGNMKDVGDLAIGGLFVGFSIMLVNMAFGMLIGVGGSAMAAIKLGEQKKEEAESYLQHTLILGVSITLILSILELIFLEPILIMVGGSPETLPFARDYMQIILLGNLFGNVSFSLNNFIRVDGSPRTAMFTMLIGAIINIILDPIFIFVFGWGVKGAAFATILSQFVSMVWVFYYFRSKRSHIKIHLKHIAIKMKVVIKIVSIGLPSFGMQIAAALVNGILSKGLLTYGGDIAVSGMGIINSLGTLLILPVVGISQGAQPIIGYNFGAKKFHRVIQALKYAIIGSTIIVTISFIVVRLFPDELIRMFNKKEELVKYGTGALKMWFTFLPIIGFQIIGTSYFQAVGKMVPSLVLSLSRQVIVLIPAVLILPRFFGVEGILYAGPLADGLSALFTAGWLYLELKHLKYAHEKSKESDSAEMVS